MNPAPTSMEVMLDSRRKDLLCAIELYLPTYEPSAVRGFEPDSAEILLATETITDYIFSTSPSIVVDYFREALSMPSLTRNKGKQSNSCTVKFSNISKRLATFVLNNPVEGMRMVVRVLSRTQLNSPSGDKGWVMFVGRCGKPEGFDRKDGSITAKQDLGQIEAMIPPKVFQKTCPLDFGGEECLGTELLTAKNAAYQTAFATLGRLGCDKTHGTCTLFANTEFYQGIRVVQIQGSFIHRPHEGFLQKLFGLLTPGSGKRRTRVGASLEDGTPYGKAVPIVLGRWLMNGIPIQYQDIGTSINFLMAFARGPIADFINIRCDNPEFTQPLGITEHYGNYGGEANQLEDTVFPIGGFYSRLAYVTGFVNGTDIAVEDPAPDIKAIVAGIAAPKVTLLSDSAAGEGTTNTPGVYQFINLSWTDNPVDLAVYVLTDSGLLNIGTQFLDEARTAKTSVYTTGAVQDDTNAERLVLPNTENGKAGTDYHRYNSTGLVCGEGTVAPIGPTFAGPAHEARYEFYDPSAPSDSVPVKTFYRKRYSCNIALTEQKKAIDVLYDTILPTFRGFLSWDTFGRVGVRSERPSDSSLMYAASIVGATSIKVNDVLPWTLQFHENNTPLLGKVLIGVGLDNTSEVRSVESTDYTADGNAITLAVSSSGGPTLTPSGAVFSGGSSSTPASATITVGGTFAEDATVTATIDGVDVTYTLFSTDTNQFEVAKALAFAINANRTLQKYVVAHNAPLEDFVTLQSKQGVLHLSSALEEVHGIGEETIRVMMSFATAALTYADTTKANILNGSFKYLGSDGQTRYNQFKGTFHDPLRDFAEHPVVINDYEHQEQVQKIFPLEIDLSAVDNYNQAARLLNGANVKFGDGLDFFSWGSNGLALQLEEGDCVCISDPNSGEWRNVPVTIESLATNEKYEVSFKSRIYSTSMFDDFVEQTEVALPSGLTNFAAPPPDIEFNDVDFPPDGLVQSTDGSAGITSIRGGAIFGGSVYPMYVKVRVIKRAGVTVSELIGTFPGTAADEIVFEFIASADGLYTVELEVCNQWDCNSTKPTASIVIGFGVDNALVTQDSEFFLTEEGEYLLFE